MDRADAIQGADDFEVRIGRLAADARATGDRRMVVLCDVALWGTDASELEREAAREAIARILASEEVTSR
jgi:hypothetical protein